MEGLAVKERMTHGKTKREEEAASHGGTDSQRELNSWSQGESGSQRATDHIEKLRVKERQEEVKDKYIYIYIFQ